VGRDHHFGNRSSSGCFGSPTEHGFGRRVEVDQVAVDIDRDDAVARGRDDRLIESLRTDQRLFGLDLLGDVDRWVCVQ
jgi:hypothetical protein